LKKVILKPGKESPLLRKHQWIFSGAVEKLPTYEPGEILEVCSASLELLGKGYFTKGQSIIGHMLAFGEDSVETAIERNIQNAYYLRKKLFSSSKTTAYRLIHAEGDLLPGLIVDQYGSTLVIQIANQGIENLKPLIVKLLQKIVSPETIYEKSLSQLRKKEGLEPKEGLISGKDSSPVLVTEEGISFYVDIVNGQKTGFFLDQREMRKWVQEIAFGKKVLNCFAYTGGFSLHALQGNAQKVVSIDCSRSSCDLLEKNVNQFFPKAPHQTLCEDVFSFLQNQNTLDFDLVILDPPAFAKKKEDLTSALQGYKNLHLLAMNKMPTSSFLFTSSCSAYIDEMDFQKAIFHAAKEANRMVSILGKHRSALDHPISLFHPEGTYLKSFLLYLH
jgi:23S rRNA (cytosine1962-C5)-methyltransferase